MRFQTPDIAPLDLALQTQLQQKIDQKTKPQSSLGRLEALALQLGLVQQTLSPALERLTIIVFTGDHGVAHAGVSAFPQEVTVQMVLNFLGGGVAINAFAGANGLILQVVNAGIARKIPSLASAGTRHHAGYLMNAIGPGTRNFAEEPAMTPQQASQALAACV